MRRLALVTTLSVLMLAIVAAPAQAIIHEILASHSNGHQEPFHPSVDPPGQRQS